MRILKILNNNAFISQDENNEEIVVMGRGIGFQKKVNDEVPMCKDCLLYTSPSPRDGLLSRMPSSA